MNRFELLQEFERQYHDNVQECDKGCDGCDYLEVCDILEQLLDKLQENELHEDE